jgi:hypothetical protein
MVEVLRLVVELVVEPAEPPSRGMPNNACSGQGFALVVRGGLLAMVMVCDGVLLVRPAANANR